MALRIISSYNKYLSSLFYRTVWNNPGDMQSELCSITKLFFLNVKNYLFYRVLVKKKTCKLHIKPMIL